MNDENLKPFVPGFDPRRNIDGRPKKLPELDKLLVEILGDESLEESEIKQIIKALVIRAKSKWGDRAAEILLERAYGKTMQGIDVTTKGKEIQQFILELPPDTLQLPANGHSKGNGHDK